MIHGLSQFYEEAQGFEDIMYCRFFLKLYKLKNSSALHSFDETVESDSTA